jgi:LPXTG-motif cell wall-anchored protein
MRSIRLVLVGCLVAAAMGLASSALAQTGSAEQPPDDDVLGEQIENEAQPGAEERGPSVLGDVTPSERGGAALPFTGSDHTLFVLAGAIAVGAGVALVRRTRATRARL